MVCNTIMEDTRAGKSVEEHPATLVEASGGQAAPGAGIQKAPVHLELDAGDYWTRRAASAEAAPIQRVSPITTPVDTTESAGLGCA